MPRTAAKFNQSDIARALRAMKQADVDMAVELRPDGTILIFRREEQAKPASVEPRLKIVL